jgi:hypothetical protein
MLCRKPLGIAIILLAGIGQTGVLADEVTHRQAVEKLFELTTMQQKIDESVANVLALQLSQSPDLQPHQDVVHEFLERHIGWKSMKDALTAMYLKEFSEQELNEINAFYSSETGQKVIRRLPVLVQLRNQLASERLQENIGELRYLIDASMKEQGKETQ